ncbi:dsDNA nuclease domain-containing protein [Massilia alkalitolerans]|uniref:dsDNA nuclease domain-containing protein n=1 Tax=Massilia alkalitolerans TaxID=286638 RepID=UPI0028B1FAAB|nr:dsDNA nuclease domain-containing protein [Massilia alkalitolerans]
MNDALINVAPAEQVGRDTLSRFDMQFQAAAFAALEILNGKSVVAVYCDYHDDFVVKHMSGGMPTYHFFQVKTKSKPNHQWNLLETFAIKQRGQKLDEDSLKRIKNSFFGKLIFQSLTFGDQCARATLLSNVHFEDPVIQVVKELQTNEATHQAVKFFVHNFSSIYSIQPAANQEDVKHIVAKVAIEAGVGYISDDRNAFINSARSAIFHHSEVDLDYYEITELANNLLELVFKKSKGSLAVEKIKELEQYAAITLDDLLKVLSISPAAYKALLNGDDKKAIKTASILHRVLRDAGATSAMIEYASAQKVAWDVWLRTSRHTYLPFDLEFLLQRIDDLCVTWQRNGSVMSDLQPLISSAVADPFVKKFNLDEALIFGGIQAVLVRRATR